MSRCTVRFTVAGILLGLGSQTVLAQAPLTTGPSFGDGAGDKYGSSITAIGDVNGDQKVDVAVGAPDADSMSLTNNGVVTVYSAGDPTNEIGRVHGANIGDRLGSALAALNDVDNDQVPDFAVGIPDFNGAGGADQGQIRIVSGATLATITSFTVDEAGIFLGSSLANVGDRNGDGIDDLLAGAPLADALASDGGAAFLLQVESTGITQLARFDGDTSGEQLGTALCNLGDVNSDSKDELAISSPFHAGGGLFRGRVQVLSGDSTLSYPLLVELTGSSDLDQFGLAIAEITDPDGGGLPQLVATFIGRNSNSGGCAIHAVPSGTLVRDYDAAFTNMFLGVSLAVVDDQDGDDVQEILIGSPLDSSGGVFSAGVVEMLSGFGDGVPGGQLEMLFRDRGSITSERFGEAIAPCADLDSDGCMDYAWTSTGAEHPTTGDATGGAHIVRSNTPRVNLDQDNYVDLDPITVETLGYASSPAFMMVGTAASGAPPWLVSFGSPFLWITGLATDSEGVISLSGNLPDAAGAPYQLFFQSFVLKPGGKPGTIHFSELAVASIN